MDNEEISRVPSSSGAAPGAPLKSALKSPGVSKKGEMVLSPTFREETLLEKREQHTTKAQRRDLLIKARVRMAKFALRGVNFSCSLIILAMLSTTLSIFNATRSLAGHNTFTPWAANSKIWPQLLVLVMSCVSLLICIIVLVSYWRGGHRRAEKVSTYYTLFSIGWFIMSMLLWAITAAIFQHTRNHSNNKDLWGWSCVQNARSASYGDMIDYSLACRLQNWALICIVIEIVVDAISIILYSIVFYRYWSKRRLAKSMDMRDKARTDLYLAQLRSNSAPNTPGFSPTTPTVRSPALSQYALSPRIPPKTYHSLNSIDQSPFTPGGLNSALATSEVPRSHFTSTSSLGYSGPASFQLQAPPTKAPSATPKMPQQATFGPTSSDVTVVPASERTPSPEPAPSSDDEPRYEAVSIPGAYAHAAPPKRV